MMSVVVPPGVAPGGTFQMQTPDGQMMVVACPPGVAPGQQMHVAIGAPPAVNATNVIKKLDGAGFELHGSIEGASPAPSDGDTMWGGWMKCTGMTCHQLVKDLAGKDIATIHHTSSNFQKGHRSARIVATDGTLIASFERRKFNNAKEIYKPETNPWQILINGAHYANVVCMTAPKLHYLLTRTDGSGGLRMGPRLTLPWGCCWYVAPLLVALESHDGARKYTPTVQLIAGDQVSYTTTLAFAPDAAPPSMKRMKKMAAYVNKHRPGALDGAARLDALCLLAVTEGNFQPAGGA